jgi:hypothetical protein
MYTKPHESLFHVNSLDSRTSACMHLNNAVFASLQLLQDTSTTLVKMNKCQLHTTE